MGTVAETAERSRKTRHYVYLDAVRIVAVIAAAAHLLGFVESGWAAVTTLLMLAGYAAARNAFANRKYSLWRGLLTAAVRVYLPLALVAGLVTLALAKFPQILWLSQKPETASVFFGINNFWQLSAGRDAIGGIFESPLTHMWAAAILLHFAVLFPFLFILLRRIGERSGRAVPCWVLIFLAAAGFAAFGLLARSGVYTAYYDSFVRASAPFLGMALAFFHHYYGTLAPRFSRGKVPGLLIFIVYLAILVYLTAFAGDDQVWRFICGRFGSGASDVFVRTLLVTLVSFRLIDRAALSSETQAKPARTEDEEAEESGSAVKSGKSASFGAMSLGISYEFYLLVTPLAFFAPYVLPDGFGPVRKIVVIALSAAVAGAVISIADGLKASAGLKALRIPLLAVCVAAAGFGGYQFAQLSDPAGSLKDLSAQLFENEKALVSRNRSYEESVRVSEEAWAKIYAGFEEERAAVPGFVSELHLTCLGDSVMVRGTANIKALFPNAVVDAKVNDTAYPALAKLKNYNAKGTLGTHIVLNYGANGDVSEAVKDSIMEQIGDRPVYWLTNTYYGRLYVNDTLWLYAEKHPNIRVVDWYEITKDHPEYFIADGVHTTPEGQEVFAQVIFDAICDDYYAEIQGREDIERAKHEQEKAQRIAFVGNDLLTGAFPGLSESFKNAGYMVISNERISKLPDNSSGFALIRTKLQAAINDGTLPHRVVLVFDATSGMGLQEYRELAALLADRELYVVSLCGSLMAVPGSRSAVDIPEGQLSGLAGAKVIEFSTSEADGLLYADRIHLTEEGNARLVSLLTERLALPQE